MHVTTQGKTETLKNMLLNGEIKLEDIKEEGGEITPSAISGLLEGFLAIKLVSIDPPYATIRISLMRVHEDPKERKEMLYWDLVFVEGDIGGFTDWRIKHRVSLD